MAIWHPEHVLVKIFMSGYIVLAFATFGLPFFAILSWWKGRSRNSEVKKNVQPFRTFVVCLFGILCLLISPFMIFIF
ncbi:MAG TPA: hypothetical protein DIU09_04745 [Hyphomonadaceae bacterium]|nr:hypothetical protein [Hyphomonadaceae bacterium]